MKVYFMASVTGREEYESNYRLIVEALEKNKCSVDSKHLFSSTHNSLIKQDLEERIRDHNRLQTLMKKADLAVAEVTYPSISIGYEIARALEWNKPLLALHLKGADPPVILKGRISDKLILESYNRYNLEAIVGAAVDYFRKVGDTRFTLLLPEKIVRYLDWIRSHRKKPRSVFIREVLLEKMSKDKDFLENENES